MSRKPIEFANYPEGLASLLSLAGSVYGPYRAISRFDQRYDDGDTVMMLMDPGWDVYPIEAVRLLGINAPETNTEAGKELRAWMAEAWVPTGAPLAVFTSWAGRNWGRDKYGRLLGVLFTMSDGGGRVNCLNTMLVEKGYAKPYIDWNEALQCAAGVLRATAVEGES